MLTDLRQWIASPTVIAKRAAGGDVFLSWDEIDMLLRVADDRDALRRELVDMPDDVTLAPKVAVVPAIPFPEVGHYVPGDHA